MLKGMEAILDMDAPIADMFGIVGMPGIDGMCGIAADVTAGVEALLLALLAASAGDLPSASPGMPVAHEGAVGGTILAGQVAFEPAALLAGSTIGELLAAAVMGGVALALLVNDLSPSPGILMSLGLPMGRGTLAALLKPVALNGALVAFAAASTALLSFLVLFLSESRRRSFERLR